MSDDTYMDRKLKQKIVVTEHCRELNIQIIGIKEKQCICCCK